MWARLPGWKIARIQIFRVRQASWNSRRSDRASEISQRLQIFHRPNFIRSFFLFPHFFSFVPIAITHSPRPLTFNSACTLIAFSPPRPLPRYGVFLSCFGIFRTISIFIFPISWIPLPEVRNPSSTTTIDALPIRVPNNLGEFLELGQNFCNSTI